MIGSGWWRAAGHVLEEAWLAVLGRPLRSTLTAAGVCLGVATAVATLGITSSAANAVTEHFDAVRATLVTVRHPQGMPAPTPTAVANVRTLNGVVRAGSMCARAEPRRVTPTRHAETGDAVPLQVLAAQSEALRARGASLRAGRWLDAGHSRRDDAAAMVDTAAARELGVGDLSGQPVAYLDGRRYAVIGVFEPPVDAPRLTRAIVLPYGGCRTDVAAYQPAETVVRTDLGAAEHVAGEVALALDPAQPDRLSVALPPDLGELRQGVETETRSLFLGLAAVSLLISAVGIANITYVAVLERRAEIGLRRATGAGRARVATQFLCESGLLGGVGGAAGAALAVTITAVTALRQGWLVVLEPAVVTAGPLLGLVIGMLAGVYPAIRAARCDPAKALRT